MTSTNPVQINSKLVVTLEILTLEKRLIAITVEERY